jgi:mitogen-activated protein kinase 1/3
MNSKEDKKPKLNSKWKQLKGKYKLINIIGEGTFGQVVQAKERDTGANCAIKFIQTDFKDTNSVRNIIRELQILRQFSMMEQNIFVTKLLDVQISNKTNNLNEAEGVFIVMEYVAHDIRSMLDKIKSDCLSEEHVKIIMYNLLCSVHFMHSAGLMHRDIKPCNLLIDGECSIKLCDFGQSRPFFTADEKANFEK